jgi:hypothetical protein
MHPLATVMPGGAERHASRLGEYIMDGGAGMATAAAIRPACLWCDTAFDPRKAGSPQRFCNSKHREAFHSAGRRFAEHAVLSGLLTAADLRNGPAEACTLRKGQGRAPDYPDIGGEETALSDAQRASVQKVQLELSIAPDGILDLCRLGWLDPDTAQDAGAVGDAVAELTNAALSLRLRPSM